MVGCGQHDEGVPTAAIAIAIVNAGVVMVSSSPLRVVAIGIVSGSVNDVVSRCLPAVAMMTTAAAAAAAVVIEGAVIVTGGGGG